MLAEITDTRHVLWGTLIGSALGLGSHLLYGALSDKIGRRPVFMIGAIFTILFGIPMFMLINTGAVTMVIVAVALSLLFSHDPIFAVESSWFSEQFPAHVRSSGISLGYNCASVVAGLLPFIATAVYSVFGWAGLGPPSSSLCLAFCQRIVQYVHRKPRLYGAVKRITLLSHFQKPVRYNFSERAIIFLSRLGPA